MSNRIRKNQAHLTESEWDKFIYAVKEIKKNGTVSPTYSEFANAHTMARHQGTAHRYPEFLPWHREYLLTFENRIREIEPDVTIPYWDWLRNRTMPPKLGNPQEWGVRRDLQINDPVTNLETLVSRANGTNSFLEFVTIINGPHGTIHVDIGGEMGEIQNSPKDVLFWLHHCFLDKLWYDWQKKNPGTEPDMSAPLLPTDLFSHSGNDVINIDDLGYEYE